MSTRIVKEREEKVERPKRNTLAVYIDLGTFNSLEMQSEHVGKCCVSCLEEFIKESKK